MSMIYFAVPLRYVLLMAHIAHRLLFWLVETVFLLLKVFAGVEMTFFLLLVAIVAISRVGRSAAKTRQPLITPETSLR